MFAIVTSIILFSLSYAYTPYLVEKSILLSIMSTLLPDTEIEIPSLCFMVLFLTTELSLTEIAAEPAILKIQSEIVLFSTNELVAA